MNKKHLSLAFFMCLLVAGSMVQAQCPEVKIKEKYEVRLLHPNYVLNGWDTAVDCNNEFIVLTADTSALTTQNFNGTYKVEEIPYNPPEPFTFGTRMPLSTDDDFAPNSINISFPFLFFGIQKNVVTLGANGMATFTPGAAGQGCPWSYNVGLPWTSGGPSPLTYMRDAIYGVYEDTYPYNLGNSARGIYYGSSPQSDYPCRHICFSWNRVPQFNKHSGSDSATYNCTYQIVIYEGTNIVEVHVKQRKVNTDWQGGIGVIGIQNATGTTQASTFNNRCGEYTDYIMPNSPAYFAPNGFNPFYTDVTERAWRFTPQGLTACNVQFFRLLSNGDSIEVAPYGQGTSALADSAGGYYYTNDRMSCVVKPTEPTKYKVLCRYRTRTGIDYYLRDTIFVGVDTAKQTSFTVGGQVMRSKTICAGDDLGAELTYPTESQVLDSCSWSAMLKCNGRDSILPRNYLEPYNGGMACRLLSTPAYHRFEHDTIMLINTASFSNGCTGHDSLHVNVFPNTKDTTLGAICDNEDYHFQGNTYTDAGEYDVPLISSHGCDSVKHLSLHMSHTSYSYDRIKDCSPITWKNGRTYYATNTTSARNDTVILKNIYGCDSTVQLDFQLFPLHAEAIATPQNADMDHLTIKLTDVSTGDSTRTWNVSGVGTSNEEVFYFGYPLEYDSVTVQLHALSPYGCEDDTSIVVHLYKEGIYVPNAFTPLELTNNTFKVYGIGLTYLEIYVYSRTGQLVYEHEGLDAEWDGTIGNGTMCQQGTYVYKIRYRNIIDPDRTYVKKGTVTLIK